MGPRGVIFSVFTKPWRELSVAQLGEFVGGMGFGGIELPVRPGCQVEPERVGQDLPGAARSLAGFGVAITSVAGPTSASAI